MLKHITSLLLLISTSSFSQFIIQGKILEEKTKSPVKYASISIINSAVGSASDEQGYFQIKIDPEHHHEKLVFSSLGFANRLIPIDSIAHRDITIYLKPMQIMLEDVMIIESHLSPEQLLKDAFAAIPKNYSQVPFNIEFYSKMELKDSTKTYYKQETILTTFRKGYIPGASNRSTITQQRTAGESPLPLRVDKKTKMKYFPYPPAFEISLFDQLGNFKESGVYSVFNPRQFRDMIFNFAGTSVFDKDTVIVVEYQHKKKKIAGTFYIAANNLAIVRHSSKKPWNFDIIYKKFDGLYYPYSLRCRLSDNFATESGIKNLYLLQTVFLRSVSTKNDLVVIDRSTPGVFWAEDIPFDQNYWDKNFPERKK